MRKYVLRSLILLFLLCITLQPLSVSAAEALDVSGNSSLELDYSSNGAGFRDLEIRVYRIAEFHADGNYALVPPFDQLPVKIHGITSQKEWRDAADTLTAYITAQQIPPTEQTRTDVHGKAYFPELQTGIYLVPGVSGENEDAIYRFENFCLFLPTPQSDGTYDYHVSAKPKGSVTPKPEEPEDTTYQVVKLWKDAGVRNLRPRSITVAILKNGVLQETVVLNAENNWSYSWTAPVGEDVWTVVELDVPDAYTVVITQSGTVFTITNTRPAPQGTPPKTGDTFAMESWLAVMSVSGILLTACGILQKRKRR